ncbi:sigma-70 family RNA polymerase sigma factor [uncultured Jatrophihabitans sp.]|uniref:sigma-70 family RNA polymerase sigma factor n=1 Tax=uncultured Jatrophihabitans sp. TaxID=1610747 RepID=UPI0035C947E5
MTRALDTAAAPSSPDSTKPTKSAEPLAASAPNADELVRQCLPLVNHLVRDVHNRVPAHVNRDDLASAAMYALAAAARGFDASLGVPFANYAALRIRGALTDELRSMDWASRDSRRRARAVETANTDLTQRLGRTPTSGEIAQEMGVSTTELSTIRANSERASVISLHAMAPEENEASLPSRLEGPEALLLRREELGYLRDAIAELPERMRLVVQDYFFGQRKMAEIAADLGVTESRVSQLRSQALGMLRVAMQAADDERTPFTTPARRGDTGARMRAAVATRSTMAERLAATTLLGESRGELGRSTLYAAT